MSISEGSTTYMAYMKEATANTEESGAGGQVLRRVTCKLDLTKPEVTSAEKRDDFQEVNVNHGHRSADWSVNGELFGGDYADFIAAQLRRDFAAVSGSSAGVGDEFSISSGTLSRASSASSFITDGLRQGMVIRTTGMTTTGVNSANLLITSVVSPTSFSVIDVATGQAPTDSSASSSAAITVPGQTTYIPSTGHTSDTFTIEKYDRATDTSRVARGVKVGGIALSIQPDQVPTIDFTGMGVDCREVSSADAPILTSPTAAGSGPTMSAAIGYLLVNGTAVAVATGYTLNAANGVQDKAVAFADVSPDIFYGRNNAITGTLNVLRQGNDISSLFDDETEFGLALFIAAPGSEPRAFHAIFHPRVKLTSATEDDPDGPVVQTCNFRALKITSGTGVEQTAIQWQDSSVA